MILASCAPVSSPSPTNTPRLAFTETAVPTPPMSSVQPTGTPIQVIIPTSTPFIKENASEDCFLSIGFTPKKTGMNDILSVWGNPPKKSSIGDDFEYWEFDFTGAPSVRFEKQILDTVIIHLKGCTLEKIITKLGPPEKIEITTLLSCIGFPPIVTQNFHYSSLGFSYFRSCDETQDCFSFHSSDIVSGKEFYSSDKMIEDSTGFNMSGYVYHWHGFDVNVEEIEDKIVNMPVPNQ